MGLVIFLVYGAALAVVCVLALVLSHFAFKGHPATDEQMRALRRRAYSVGIAATTAIAVLMAFEFPVVGAWLSAPFLGGPVSRPENALLHLIDSAAITLLVPICIGATLFVIAKVAGGNRTAIVGWLSAGALHSSVLTPFAALLTFGVYSANESRSAKAQFDRLCTQADIQLLEHVAPAQSLTIATYLAPSLAEGLLMNTPLAFVERMPLSGDRRYGRLSKIADAGASEKQGKWTESPADALRGEYVVLSTAFMNAAEAPNRAERVEVRRRSDNRLIAFVQFFSNTEHWWACPAQTADPLFFHDFIKDTLNIRNPEERDRVAQEQRCSKSCSQYSGGRFTLVARNPWGLKGPAAEQGPWGCYCK